MKHYEMVREIFNQCSGNQMRDVYIEEVDTDDPVEYIRSISEGKNVQLESMTLPDGDVVVDVNISDQLYRYTFTEV